MSVATIVMASDTVGVVNLGLGNIRSVLNMLDYIHVPAVEICSPADLAQVQRLILPGVGHFDREMEALERAEWRSHIEAAVQEQHNPILGICLGMQVLSRGSEEGEKPGLGWIPAEFKKFSFAAAAAQRVPHMGWNVVEPVGAHPLVKGLEAARFYFVHSYYAVCDQEDVTILKTQYGPTFVSGYAKGRVMGVQFHPEKSHQFGMRLLKNFAEADFS